MGDTLPQKTIDNWQDVVDEKSAFLNMVINSGFPRLNKFIEYFEKETGRLKYHNVLLLEGFGETRIELLKSFHKAHRSIAQKYGSVAQGAEWGGSYNEKYDGMHFGLKTTFIKTLTNKQ